MSSYIQSMKTLFKEDTWVKPFFFQYRKTLLAALFLGFMTFAFSVMLMFTSGYLVSGSAEVVSILMLHIPLIFVRIFGIGKPIIHYIERLLSHDWILNMTSKLRQKLYDAVEQQNMFEKATHKTGDLLGLLSEDIAHIQNLYLRCVFPVVIATLLCLFVIIGLGLFSWWIAGCIFVVLFINALVLPIFSVIRHAARRMKIKQLRNTLYGELTDNILGVSDWIFSQRKDEYLSHYATSIHAIHENEMRLARNNRNSSFIMQAVFLVGIITILIWAANYFASPVPGGSANWIAAFVLAFFPVIEALIPLPEALVDTASHTDAIKNVNALDSESKQRAHAQATEIPTPTKPYTIELSHVDFTYPDTTKKILDDFSLTVTQGEKIALLGRSGSGKSTLAMLIHGDTAPDAGTITIGGVPAHVLHPHMAQYLGVIQQSPYLFSMTLLENVRIGAPDATREEVLQVLDQVGLSDLVNRLPEGLDTIVAEDGLRFSGGERHRVALARILLQKSPLVILDEPTVGLDPQTESALLKTMFSALQDKTVIMITHHLKGASLMDRVIFLDKGKISIEGSPGQLEKENEYYQKLIAFDQITI